MRCRIEAHAQGVDVDERIDRLYPLRGGCGLVSTDIGLAKNRLSLQVRFVDHVVIDDSDPPDPGRREILKRRRSQTARTDDENAGCAQPLLPGQSDLGNQEWRL